MVLPIVTPVLVTWNSIPLPVATVNAPSILSVLDPVVHNIGVLEPLANLRYILVIILLKIYFPLFSFFSNLN
jgi:hypothetical protein